MRILNKSKQLKKLFCTMFYISAFTFGGGYVIVGLMRSKFVSELKWLTEDEMLDITAIAQSSPGAVAVNASIMVGWKVAGIWGMASAVIGTVLPPLTILFVISLLYEYFAENLYVSLFLGGMKIAVAALVISIACDMGIVILKQKCVYKVVIMLLAFVLVFFLKVNVILIVFASLLLSVILAERNRKKRKNDLF